MMIIIRIVLTTHMNMVVLRMHIQQWHPIRMVHIHYLIRIINQFCIGPDHQCQSHDLRTMT